ncbi:MAG TPA: RDD family protein [Candidatus Krumholzibacteria bacterium]|nr:RDD family protein [Candidatus Krumholzibacteria bacterium]
MIAMGAVRVKAFLYDYLLILAYLIVLSGIGTFLTLGPFATKWSDFLSSPIRMDLFAFCVSVLPVVLYFAFTESSPAAASWGKRRVGVVVLTRKGEHMSKGRSLARSSLKFFPWQMSHTAMFHIPGFPAVTAEPPGWTVIVLVLAWILVGVYLLGLTAIGAGGRTVYDRLTGSSVVIAATMR